jgi:hypothetical protein
MKRNSWYYAKKYVRGKEKIKKSLVPCFKMMRWEHKPLPV